MRIQATLLTLLNLFFLSFLHTESLRVLVHTGCNACHKRPSSDEIPQTFAGHKETFHKHQSYSHVWPSECWSNKWHRLLYFFIQHVHLQYTKYRQSTCSTGEMLKWDKQWYGFYTPTDLSICCWTIGFLHSVAWLTRRCCCNLNHNLANTCTTAFPKTSHSISIHLSYS